MGRASAVSTVKADSDILARSRDSVAGRSRAVTVPLYTPGMPCRVWAPHLRKDTEGLERVQSREGSEVFREAAEGAGGVQCGEKEAQGGLTAPHNP